MKSDVVHLIMVCGVLLLQFFGTSQLGHTGFSTHLFACACVEAKFMAIPFRASFHAIKQADALGMNSAGCSYGSPMKILAVLHICTEHSCHIFRRCGEIARCLSFYGVLSALVAVFWSLTDWSR